MDRRQALLKEYADASERYAQAVAHLKQRRPLASKVEYDDLFEIVEEARKDCVRTRLALERNTHIAGP